MIDIESVTGKLAVYCGRADRATANPPVHDGQIGMNDCWKQAGGTVGLPGTNRAADGFAPAAFPGDACKQSADPRETVAGAFSVACNGGRRGTRSQS